MFGIKYLLVAVAAAGMLHRGDSFSIDVSDMMNKTLCAIRVHYDENENRIPKRIKMLKCEENTEQGCLLNNIEMSQCCHGNFSMQCVEMKDTVLVYNKKINDTQEIEVSVGCACMIQTPNVATPVTEVLIPEKR